MALKNLDFSRLRTRLAGARTWLAGAYVRLGKHRRGVVAVAAVLMVVFAVAALQATRFALDVFTGLPHRDDLIRMGRMAQSTTLFDGAGRPAFTLSKEERIEVPLSATCRRA